MQISQSIDAPVERVWAILTDTRQWPVWGPSVSAVACRQRHISAGVKGRVKTAIGVWLAFEIIRFEPPDYWCWQVAGLAATGHRLQRIDSNRCQLIFEMPVWAFPYALVCQRASRNIARLATSDRGKPGR